jgi:peptidoglycan/xylan/chitin deacetylase (PgdA/CDA1 family)
MSMKAIMYHYVRPSDPKLPYLKHLHFDDFKLQLDFFEETYGILSQEEFIKSLRTGEAAKGVVLTFDDALSCHYDFVYKELKRRNLWGIFYVPTLMFSSDKILDVHRIHILLGMVESQMIYNELINLVTDEMCTDASKIEFKTLTYNTQKNDSYTNLVKRILNYFISYEFRESIIDQLMEKFIPENSRLRSKFYITEEQILEMQENGMTIGSHTASHPVLSKLNRVDQHNEILSSFSFLEQTCKGLPYRTFCYPYGGFHSFNQDTVNVLNENDCLFSFNVEHRDIVQSDLLNHKQELPRYDCNQFKFGQIRE